MDPAVYWYFILGILLVVLAAGNAMVRRLPLTAAIVYLAAGYLLGPRGAELFDLHPLDDSRLLERLAEIAVIISLFSAGLKLRLDPRDRLWREPIRLAFVSMATTVALIAAAGVGLLGLPLGAAILLGAILAPTDPVLASEVAVEEPGERDRLRVTLTGEAGLNDGVAFPFVMLGLGLMGLHPVGPAFSRWLALDVLWATVGGLAIGAILGRAVGLLIRGIRRRSEEEIVLDDFLAVGLIALAYGAAVLAHTYGFLAVFAAGLAVRPEPPQPEDAPAEAEAAHVGRAVLLFNQQIERIAELILVIVVGGMLSADYLPFGLVWFLPFLFLFVRPVAVMIGLAGRRVPRRRMWLVSWFGIRGVGSIYYLMFAINRGLPRDQAAMLAALVLSVVAVSVVVHGVTVTPLMRWYDRRESAPPP
ncbi:MAG TPA: cation:proton antiporter [Thermoanaerobaculia bacterium]